MQKYYLLLAFSFLVTFGYTQEKSRFEKIDVGYGPEDFVLDTFNMQERLLISCSSRRKTEPEFKEIVALHISTNSTYILPRLNEPTDLYFSPHGIDLAMVDGKLNLYVVNHSRDNTDQILIYEVIDSILVFKKSIYTNYFVSLNSVAALPNGNFYVTNDAGKKNALFEKLFALRKSNVVYFDLEKEKSEIVIDKLAYANGLAIKDDKLYVSTTQKKDLLEMRINENGSLNLLRKFEGVKGMDNITISGNYMFIPAHTDFLKFIKHYKNDEALSPNEILVYDLNTNKKTKIFADDGSKISAPATALFYNGNMYVGQVFNTHLLKIKLNLD